MSFKIINATGQHFGIQYDIKESGHYHDIHPFDPKNDQTGLHFAKENILAFLDYGTTIWKVTVPESAEVCQVDESSYKTNEYLLSEPQPINLATIDNLVSKEGVNPRCLDDTPLILAASLGNFELFQYFHNVHGADLNAQNDYAYSVAKYKHKSFSDPYSSYLQIMEYIFEHSKTIPKAVFPPGSLIPDESEATSEKTPEILQKTFQSEGTPPRPLKESPYKIPGQKFNPFLKRRPGFIPNYLEQNEPDECFVTQLPVQNTL